MNNIKNKTKINKSEVSDYREMEILHTSASIHVLGTSPQVLHQIAIITINLYHPPKNGRAASYLIDDRLSRKVEIS